MEITEVRVKLVNGKNDKLRAFCSITIDNDFVIRDLKVIDGVKGPFVAMPSRKLTEKCPKCHCKNHFRAKYCNECGNSLPKSSKRYDSESYDEYGQGGRSKLHTEIAHPINSSCRERIQNQVLDRYHEELEAYEEELEETGSYSESEEGFENFEDNFDNSEKSYAASSKSRLSEYEDEEEEEGEEFEEEEYEEEEYEEEEQEEFEEEEPQPAYDDPGLAWSVPPENVRGGRLKKGRGEEPPKEGYTRGGRNTEEDSPERNPRKIPGPQDAPSSSQKQNQKYYDDANLGDDSEPEDNFGAGLF